MQSDIKVALKDFKKMSADQQMQYDQDAIVLHRLLALPADHQYTEDDLDQEPILLRAIDLIYRRRFGIEDERITLSALLNYDALPKSPRKKVKGWKSLGKENFELHRKRGEQMMNGDLSKGKVFNDWTIWE